MLMKGFFFNQGFDMGCPDLVILHRCAAAVSRAAWGQVVWHGLSKLNVWLGNRHATVVGT
jgi:hypothetical protein